MTDSIPFDDIGLPPLSIGKIRLSRTVFGDIMQDDSMLNHSMVSTQSLCYSTSPVQYKVLNESRDTPTPMAIQFDSEHPIGDEEEAQSRPPKGFSPTNLNSGPFNSIIAADDDDELHKENNDPVCSALVKPIVPTAPIKKCGGAPVNIVRFESKRLKQRTAMTRDREQTTQTAISNATQSVNQTLNAVRKAKKDSQRQRAEQTSRVRDQWMEEKEEAKAFYQEAEKNRQELLAMQKQLSSKFQRERVRSDQNNMQSRLNDIEKESQFKSKVFRDHKRELKEEETRRRRMSTDARAKLRRNYRDGEEKMNMIAIAEDQALAEERQESSVAMRKYKQEDAKQKRKSFQFRNGDARRIRELHAMTEAECMEQEHASYELKRAGEKDAEAYQKLMADERRKSLAFRHQDGHRQRDVQANLKCAQDHLEHKSYVLKCAGEKDAEAYQKLMAEEHRKDIAFRNEEGRRQRDVQANLKCAEESAKHASYELKWGGEKDAEAYQKLMAEEHRKDIASRNEENSQHREVMQELKSLTNEKEIESLMLKWSGEEDSKAYLVEMEEERRKSIQFRNQEGKRYRDLEAEECYREVQEDHVEEVLQAACRKDVLKYKKECDNRDRASLCFKRKEANIQRLEEETQCQRDREIEEKNLQLEDAARLDVEGYLKDCKRRRRMSLAFRAKEKRRHLEWGAEQADLEQRERSRDTRYRALDGRYVELARQKERARIAMDAIRHAGCSFAGNPFAAML